MIPADQDRRPLYFIPSIDGSSPRRHFTYQKRQIVFFPDRIKTAVQSVCLITACRTDSAFHIDIPFRLFKTYFF